MLDIDSLAKPTFPLGRSVCGESAVAASAPRPFGLSKALPTGLPVLDLSGLSYDPMSQVANVDPSLLPRMATMYTTTEDHQSWTDKD